MFGKMLKSYLKSFYLKNLLYHMGLSNVRVIVLSDKEGNKVREVTLDSHGTIIRRVVFHKNGNVKEIIRYDNHKVVLAIDYYETGSIKSARIEEPGMPNEICLAWNENGEQELLSGSYSAEKFFKKLAKA